MGSIRKLVFAGILLWSFSFQLASAQTFAEWFSQKKTQLKYLTQQIAALEQYGAYVKQGYQISRQGLGGIGSWVKGELDLHNGYYRSLRTVNPYIRDNPRADSIVRMAQAIIGQFAGLNGLELDEATARYVRSVRASVLADCDRDVTELQMVLSGRVEMTDDERLQRLQVIYERMSAKLVFARSFCSQVRVLVNSKALKLQELQTQKRIYETH